jgi:hypothetical protein
MHSVEVDLSFGFWRVSGRVAFLATILITLSLAVPAVSIELFRYRGAAKDGGTLEYVFEGGEQNSPNAITKEKAAEIAADFMTTFYHVQIGALETQEFREQPLPFWLVSPSDTVKGPMHNRTSSSRHRTATWLKRESISGLAARRAQVGNGSPRRP